MPGQRGILHALLDLEGLGLIALLGGNGLVKISRHGVESGARYRVRTCDFLRVKQALYR